MAVEGRPPLDRVSLLATFTAIIEDAPALFLRGGPLRPVIEGLLAKDPSDGSAPTTPAPRSELSAHEATPGSS
jgi:eukaryotic-like serine/threonine-protein kinase